MVIAVVFNSEKHEGYAVPPNENPFDAYYVDETVASIPSVDDIAPQLQIINPKEGVSAYIWQRYIACWFYNNYWKHNS
ncbi:MAG: hypothetical protein FE047_01975 [Thermoplasmata archaeon]|nr:MAG: hypothetical protein FE047_01975 [Thermoplasmata archaeon]